MLLLVIGLTDQDEIQGSEKQIISEAAEGCELCKETLDLDCNIALE